MIPWKPWSPTHGTSYMTVEARALLISLLDCGFLGAATPLSAFTTLDPSWKMARPTPGETPGQGRASLLPAAQPRLQGGTSHAGMSGGDTVWPLTWIPK